MLFCKSQKIKYVYFDSYKKTVSLFLLRVCHFGKYPFNMIMRANTLYELKIQSPSNQKQTIFYLRDYRKLLDFPIETLHKEFVSSPTIPTLCPRTRIQRLEEEELLEEAQMNKELYVRAKAFYEVFQMMQEIVFHEFRVDMIQTRTISGLAMRIFTTHFLPHEKPIYTNSEENDAFIRQGYYGGHTEVYRPSARNVFVYDVNSIYPFTMCKDMPSYRDSMIEKCNNIQLKHVFGFVEATIDCPASIHRPFLPFRGKHGIIYPTGK